MRTATFDDIPAVVAVGKACDLQDIGELDVFDDWVHDEWVRPRFDPSTDAWVVTEPGGQVVAATYTWDEEPRTPPAPAPCSRGSATPPSASTYTWGSTCPMDSIPGVHRPGSRSGHGSRPTTGRSSR